MKRTLWLLLLGLLMLPLAACGGSSPSQDKALATEVKLDLSLLADSPTSGVRHGTEVLLTPICTSTVDPAYRSVVAWPYDRAHRAFAEPVVLYMRRVSGGYRVIADVGGSTPVPGTAGVPPRVLTDLSRPACQPNSLTSKSLIHIRGSHTAPDFTL